MIWLVLAVLGLALVLRRLRIRFYREHWNHLSSIISDIAQGRKPGSFVFHRAPHFTKVALELENIYNEQVRIRQQASNQEYNLKTVLASMAEGVIVIDSTKVIRLVNRALLGLLELKEEPVGKTVLSGIRSAELEALVRQAFETGAPQNQEIAIKSGLGRSNRYFEVNVVPIGDMAARINDVVAVFHDISRMRRLEELRREFVANVSHELKTPLSIFQGYLETLEEPGLEPTQTAEIIGIMKRHSHRLNTILEDLLDLAKLEARTEQLRGAHIDLGEFMTELCRDWEPRCATKKVFLKTETPNDLPVLWADPQRLNQAITNLLQNALKYTEPGGTITIEIGCNSQGIILGVTDTGLGIPPDDLPHIFERFYRVEKGRSRESGGTGLGLAIVKHIMALHGGSAEASSVYGQGTRLSLIFPGQKAVP